MDKHTRRPPRMSVHPCKKRNSNFKFSNAHTHSDSLLYMKVLPVIPESGRKREEAIRLTGGYQRKGERGEVGWDHKSKGG